MEMAIPFPAHRIGPASKTSPRTMSLPNDFWEAGIDAIVAKCEVEDAERRTAAKALLAKPRSRKRR
jgi:hypothetical protein